MTMRKTGIGSVLTVTAAATLDTTSPASAGGVGDFLSPAFGAGCANQQTGAHARGTTTHGTGAANSNLAGLPIGSPLNQCGGADASLLAELNTVTEDAGLNVQKLVLPTRR